MNRQTRTLCILAAVLVLCGAVYALLRWWNAAQADRAAESAVYVVRMEDLTGIAVERDGSTTTYTKGGDGNWSVGDQSEFPLRQSYLTSMEDTLGALEAVKTISSPEEDASYGLDSPICRITAESADGTTFVLLVGGEVNGNYYARMDGETTVYTISSALVDETGYSLLSMIDRDTIPTVTDENFASLSLMKDGKIYEYTKEQMEDDEALSTAVSDLATLSFSSTYAWRPTAEELAASGLSASAVLTVTDDMGGAYTLELGADDGNGHYYARLKDSEQVNLISSTWAEDILALAA